MLVKFLIILFILATTLSFSLSSCPTKEQLRIYDRCVDRFLHRFRLSITDEEIEINEETLRVRFF